MATGLAVAVESWLAEPKPSRALPRTGHGTGRLTRRLPALLCAVAALVLMLLYMPVAHAEPSKADLLKLLDELRMEPHPGPELAPLLALGRLALEEGDCESALRHLQRARQRIALLNAQPGRDNSAWPEARFGIETDLTVAQCLQRLNRTAESEALFAQAIGTLRAEPQRREALLAKALESYALLKWASGDGMAARGLTREAAEMSGPGDGDGDGDPNVALAERLRGLARMASRDGEDEAARADLSWALSRAQQVGLGHRAPPIYLLELQRLQAMALLAQGRRLAAAQLLIPAIAGHASAQAPELVAQRLLLEVVLLEAQAADMDALAYFAVWDGIEARARTLPRAQLRYFAEELRMDAWRPFNAALNAALNSGERNLLTRHHKLSSGLATTLLQTCLPSEHPHLRRARLQWASWELLDGERTSAQQRLESLLGHVAGTVDDAAMHAYAMQMLSITHLLLGHDDMAILLGKLSFNAFLDLPAQGSLAQDCNEAACINLALVTPAGQRLAYEWVTQLLIRSGRLTEAQELLQMLREQELSDALRSAVPRYQSRRATLTELEQRQRAGLAALPALDQSASTAKQETLQIRKVLEQAAREAPQAGAVALQFMLTAKTLNIFVTAPGKAAVVRQIALDREALYDAIARLQVLLRTPDSSTERYRAVLRLLHEQLIVPVSEDLKQLKAHTLMLSLDERLRLIPFAALLQPDGHYLMERYALVLYNEAAGGSLPESAARNWHVAAMGLSRPVAALPALKAVPDELSRVVRSARAGGKIYLDGQFTRGALNQVLARQTTPGFNVLHVASHFVLYAGQPDASVLYLGDGSAISLGDMARSNLDFSGLQLVVYSACDTGLAGGKKSNGMEMDSLSAQTLRQGGQAVLGTLWRVSDTGMATAMDAFYKQGANLNLTLAEALQRAQRQLQAGPAGGTDLSHPFYWAPFVLMGNWR